MTETVTEVQTISKREMLDNLSNRLDKLRIGVELGNTTWRRVWPAINTLANVHSGLLDFPENAVVPARVQDIYHRVIVANKYLFEGEKNG